MAGWRAELAGIGLTPAGLARKVTEAAAAHRAAGPELSLHEVRTLAEATLAAGGPLAGRKVFTRRDVVVAVAPALFGRDPDELGGMVDRVLADREVVPLVGVAGASERAYTTASVIAIESAIAQAVARGLEETGPAVVPAALVDASVARREAELGRPLTRGQGWAVRGICTSGRRVELVVGVAGSGKTTALACVRHAYQAAGYRVVGTSTSGQAARTLGREAGIDESGTLASLLWRLDHGRVSIDARTVVILDEAGVTADPDLLRLLVAAEAARAKVVLVGDDRQLGPVGPGGALAGLVERAGAVVHLLDENVRQADPGERRALNRLRAGDVERAVDWYHRHGRIATAPTRGEALDAMVDAWLAETRSGLNSGLYAWRRANVAELNRRARAAWAADGRLAGPEVEARAGAATPPATGSSPSPRPPTGAR